MAAQKRRGCLGCSFPVLIIVGIITLGIVVVGFLAGAIGQKLFPGINLPEVFAVPPPDPHLPAPVLFHLFGLPITVGVLAGWLTVVVLVALSWAVTRRIKIIPGRLQVTFEAVLGWIFDLCKSVAGEENGRRFFPVICTLFLFVLFNAWLSLLPGFGPAFTNHGEEFEILRGANADINTPLALAVISFVFVAYYGFKSLGIGWLRQYFNFGPLFRGIGRMFKGKFSPMDIFSGVITAFVGGLEFLSRIITIISFTFRLFGNMTAGEILLLIAAFLVPWVLALPFYGLELLIGLVQALIFSLLTLVFVTMAVAPHEHET
ncbi:F0F1 ATP synthase subunit A [Chloroflexota bacterium]